MRKALSIIEVAREIIFVAVYMVFMIVALVASVPVTIIAKLFHVELRSSLLIEGGTFLEKMILGKSYNN